MQLIGRRSSLFTRLPWYFAERLGVSYELVVIPDMTKVDPAAFGDNPALKLPILRLGTRTVFGAQNLCRVIVEQAAADASRPARIVWPEHVAGDDLRNAHELVAHCMAAQVQLVMGTVLAGLPADNVFFVKARISLQGALAWLDEHLDRVLDGLPPRDFSFLEISLLALIEHLAFRPTVSMEPYAQLRTYVGTFASDPAAQRTAYRFDS